LFTTHDVIDELLAQAAGQSQEQRGRRRFPYFRPLRIDDAGAATALAFSRDVSLGGMGILHREPLESTSLSLTVPTSAKGTIPVRLQIAWSELCHDGWYASGGTYSGSSTMQIAKLLVASASDEVKRRVHEAFPFFRPVSLLCEDGRILEGSVFSRDISATGIGLFHRQPLPTRRVVLGFETTAGDLVELGANIKWCRPVHDQWFVSHGEFTRPALACLPELQY